MKFLMLVFDLPKRDGYGRIKIWRKLRKIGAKFKYGSHWVLPFNKKNLIELKEICKEIRKLNGKAEVIKGEKVV